MAAIFAGRTARASGASISIMAFDGAERIGAKILIAGGGRCNVTHDIVDESAFAGSTKPAIRNVLRRFDVDRTVRFFADLDVSLKREETGKLFPVTDNARTVLDALLAASREAGVEMVNPWRVDSISAEDDGFELRGPAGAMRARRVVLATGGKSVPKTGSDGHGLELARRLGHTTTRKILPGLVPLLLAERCFIRDLAGVTLDAAITLRSASGKALALFSGSTLCTHVGLSGPPVLDISRYWLHAHLDDPGAHLTVDWLPELGGTGLAKEFSRRGGPAIGTVLRALLPERLADALCVEARIDHGASYDRLSRDARDELVRTVCSYRLPVTGDRGFSHAEVTAGGVPLAEVNLRTMESRVRPGLHLVGEILDVDGRIGGFNFQWAWASGFVAGTAIPSPQGEPPTPRGSRGRGAARRRRTP